MLSIQAQNSVNSHQQVNFKGSEKAERSYFDDESYDEFDREAIEADRDEKIDQINQSRDDLETLADELDKNGGKVGQKASKFIRYGATIMGIAATFIAAKVSSKLAIETLKSFGNSKGAQSVINTVKSAKEPLGKVVEGAKNLADKAIKSPVVKENLEKITNSKIGQKTAEILKNEKVIKILEPVKNTLKSMKDIKLNGAKIQSYTENIMAATTTGSVIVDDIAGRNKNKSNAELATGV